MQPIHKLVLVLFLNIALFNAQTLNITKLDSFINLLSDSNKGMGSVCISKNNINLYTKAFGYTCINGGKVQFVNINTKYRIASITKIFTTVLTLQLIEKNKIKYTTKLSEFFPKIPNAKKITIEDMLYHRSGLYDYLQDSSYLKNITKTFTKEEYIQLFTNSKPIFKPKERTEYSNTNFILLGYVLEKIYNSDYETILKQKIVEPIGLKSITANSDINCLVNECNSFDYFNNSWVQQENTNKLILGAAGSISSTASDLTAFLSALFKGKLLNETSITMMKTSKGSMGMGLMEFPYYKKRGFGHTGGVDGFRSVALYFPDDSLTIAYLSNGEVYPRNLILYDLLNIYYGKKFKMPVFNTFKITSEELIKFHGDYANSTINLSIKISSLGTSLLAQATGQPNFSLEAYEPNKFKSDKIGAKLEFRLEKNELILFQNGQEIIFTKK